MLIWINGAFGSGKTTLTEELRRRLPDALVFDPEWIGFVLREIVPVPTWNFQDLVLWRRQVTSLAAGLVEEYPGRPVLVPMTPGNPAYLEEIIGGLRRSGIPLHHLFLKVSAGELERRLDARVLHPDDPERDEAARRWARKRIPECVAAVDSLPGDTLVLDGERPTRDLADEVVARVGRFG
ncbi:AAA family ATPase [Streptomyces calidiresistens]|uniref:AAA family ATPase n=1 Tax=Streptomyces calidiresistens TaxID=1485586 RepID=A0A7W3T6X7_9ACTN|nr:AAA family ATPase [Streptomyces calidiresistens]MBB0231913.1 AAA family ATPase [Streptomyces calidiresistens]